MGDKLGYLITFRLRATTQVRLTPQYSTKTLKHQVYWSSQLDKGKR